MAKRMQSPSSINLYRQCPRKYYYQYILKLPTQPSIHLVRGKAVHDALEKFYEVPAAQWNQETYPVEMKVLLLDLFDQAWKQSKSELGQLGMSEHDIMFYYQDSKQMLERWLQHFLERLAQEKETRGFEGALHHLTPIREKHYKSDAHQVRGFIDAIYEWGDGVHILDYKTSKKDDLTDAYRLQLGIYALLYHEQHGIAPKRVGIHFLKFGEKYIEVDELLIQEAKDACELIQLQTDSEVKEDYPKHISPLCKWSTGQCDFYETCVKDE